MDNDTNAEPEEEEFIGRARAHTTYLKYAKKYKIPVRAHGKKKEFKELAQDIYEYEMKHIHPKPGKYGLYVLP